MVRYVGYQQVPKPEHKRIEQNYINAISMY